MKSFSLCFLVIFLAAAAHSQSVRFRNGVFLHHSTGACIWGPNGSSTNVPQEIAAYNASHGLTGADAMSLDETGWPVTPWDNEWARWHRIFDGVDPDADISPFLSSYKIVIIKSCFPSSNLPSPGGPPDTLSPSDKTVYNYKWHWRNFIRVMAGHPEIFFVVWTSAPLVAAATTDQEAANSSSFCRWAADTLAAGLDPVFGAFPPNIAVFDFFHILAGPDGKLRAGYASSESDSHPNAAATALAAPLFVQTVFEAAAAYELGQMTAPPQPSLLLPPDHAVNQPTTPVLRWHQPSNALGYRLQIAPDTGFAASVAVDTILTDTTFVPVPFANGSTWFWHVRGENTAGSGEWSPVWQFSIVPDTGAWYHVDAQWNLLSLPGHVADPRKSLLFPDAISGAFFYSQASGYHSTDSLKRGRGYWLKFGIEEMIGLISDTVLLDTIALQQGWNLVGSISVPVPAAAVVSDEPDVVLSQFFGYRGRYAVADTLMPGKGYWVKADRVCTIFLPAPGMGGRGYTIVRRFGMRR